MAVVKTKAGTYAADVWYRDAEGKLKRHEKTFAKEREAEAWHDEQKTLVRRREFVSPPRIGRRHNLSVIIGGGTSSLGAHCCAR